MIETRQENALVSTVFICWWCEPNHRPHPPRELNTSQRTEHTKQRQTHLVFALVHKCDLLLRHWVNEGGCGLCLQVGGLVVGGRARCGQAQHSVSRGQGDTSDNSPLDRNPMSAMINVPSTTHTCQHTYCHLLLHTHTNTRTFQVMLNSDGAW